MQKKLFFSPPNRKKKLFYPLPPHLLSSSYTALFTEKVVCLNLGSANYGPWTRFSLCWFFNGLWANKGFNIFMNKKLKRRKRVKEEGEKQQQLKLYMAHKAWSTHYLPIPVLNSLYRVFLLPFSLIRLLPAALYQNGPYEG